MDEKYPFLVYNIFKTGVPTVILLDGRGYRKDATAWLKDQADRTRAFIAAWDMMEFQTQVNDGFLG